MKTITLKNGKTLEMEMKSNGFHSLNSFFELKIVKGEYTLTTWRASKELADYFNVGIQGKETALRIEKELFDELSQELDDLQKKERRENYEKRKAYIATRPQKKVLMFSGWYLIDPAEIVTLFEDEEGLWYVSETHNVVSELKIKDALDNGLTDISIRTRLETRCFDIDDNQIQLLLSICKERKTGKENKEKEEEVTIERKKTELIEKAKIEGKSQKYAEWTEDCDGSVDECSTDIITQYINENGKFEYERTHTY